MEMQNGVIVVQGRELSSPAPKIEIKHTAPCEGHYDVSVDGTIIGMTKYVEGKEVKILIHTRDKVDGTKTRWGDKRRVGDIVRGVDGYENLENYVKEGKESVTRWFQVVTSENQCSSTLPIVGDKLVYLGTSDGENYKSEEIPFIHSCSKIEEFLLSSAIVYPYKLSTEEAMRIFQYGTFGDVPHYDKLDNSLFGNRVVFVEDNTIKIHTPLRQEMFELVFNLKDGSRYLNVAASCFHIFGNNEELDKIYDSLPKGIPYTKDAFKLVGKTSEEIRSYVEVFVASNDFPVPKKPNLFVKRGTVLMALLLISPNNILTDIVEGFKHTMEFKRNMIKALTNLKNMPSIPEIEKLEDVPGFLKSHYQRSRKSMIRISKAPNDKAMNVWIDNERNKYHIHKFLTKFKERFEGELVPEVVGEEPPLGVVKVEVVD